MFWWPWDDRGSDHKLQLSNATDKTHQPNKWYNVQLLCCYCKYHWYDGNWGSSGRNFTTMDDAGSAVKSISADGNCYSAQL